MMWKMEIGGKQYAFYFSLISCADLREDVRVREKLPDSAASAIEFAEAIIRAIEVVGPDDVSEYRKHVTFFPVTEPGHVHDWRSSGRVHDEEYHVQFPLESRNVCSCGGEQWTVSWGCTHEVAETHVFETDSVGYDTWVRQWGVCTLCHMFLLSPTYWVWGKEEPVPLERETRLI